MGLFTPGFTIDSHVNEGQTDLLPQAMLLRSGEVGAKYRALFDNHVCPTMDHSYGVFVPVGRTLPPSLLISK